jgi:hypothetical protein
VSLAAAALRPSVPVQGVRGLPRHTVPGNTRSSTLQSLPSFLVGGAGKPVAGGAALSPGRRLPRRWLCARSPFRATVVPPTSPAHENRTATHPGSKNNGSPHPSPKRKNTESVCGDLLPALPLPLGLAPKTQTVCIQMMYGCYKMQIILAVPPCGHS